MKSYWAGFTSLIEEKNNINLIVQGKIPTWLEGMLIRIGPAQFNINDIQLNHWFDGFAMLYKFHFNAGKIYY